MIIDTQSTFSDKQVLSQAAGTYPSTNILDAGAANADSGHGEGQGTFVNFQVNEDFASATSAATVNVKIQTSSDEAFTSPVDLWTSGAKAIAGINAGLDPVRLPLGVLRYIRVAYVIAAETTTAGRMSAFLTKDITRQRAYPIGHS